MRYAIRSLRKNPSFAAVVLLTLALGIGTNAAIFSAVNAVVLRPLPYADATRLMVVWGNLHRPGVEGFRRRRASTSTIAIASAHSSTSPPSRYPTCARWTSASRGR